MAKIHVWVKENLKTIYNYLNNIVILIILIILFTAPTYLGLFRDGYFFMQDDLQAFRVQQMDKCFNDFQIPCRWIPDGGYGYGYPQFNYYPPFPYYLGVLFAKLGMQYIDSVKLLFILGYVLSAISFFILVKELLGKFPAFISALLYTYIPYKAVEVYVRGALSEFWAQIFFPLILLFIYKLIKTREGKFILYLGVSIALLATTHTLMTIIFAPFAIFWAVYWLLESKFTKDDLLNLLYSGFLAFGLSAYFMLPVAFERSLVHIESMLSGYFDYRAHFVSLYKLLLSTEWGYGSSGFPDEKLNLSIGIIQWIVGLGAIILAFFNRKKYKSEAVLTFLIFIFALLTLFMMHLKSSFIWSLLPFLWYMQFPWRFLALSIFLICLLSAYFLNFISGNKRYVIGIIIVIIAFLTTRNYFVPKEWYYGITDRDKFSGKSWQKQMTISIFDYLPKTAVLPPINEAPDLPEVLEGVVNFASYEKGSNFQKGKIVVEKDATIRLPIIDFAGMKLYVNGKEYDYINNDCRGQEFCYGLVTFRLPRGEHDILVKLGDTPVRKIGNIISLLSLFILFTYVYKFFSKDKK